jgi:predicted nuclease with TOPRIM domain
MENEKFQELVLQQLKILTDGQHRLESRLTSVEDRIISLEKGQQELFDGQKKIENQLDHIWKDIKKLDDRISRQEEETALLKRLK